MNQIDREKCIKPFIGVHFIEHENGYIVWRMGTGYNIELLHLKTYVPKQGTGHQLIKAMLTKLKESPPYQTVFGFTRHNNYNSQKFYEAQGFELSEVSGVYADGVAVVFSQEYKKLLELHEL
jgi:ribosomal protein S18 acetylase RimI-like enzyme